jgi:hypothetical protein
MIETMGRRLVLASAVIGLATLSGCAAQSQTSTIAARSAAAEPPAIAPAPAPASESPPPPRDPFAFMAGPDGVLHPADVALVPALGAAPLVRLDEPGAEPRSELRYRLQERATEHAIELELDRQTATTVDGELRGETFDPSVILELDMVLSDATSTEARVMGEVRSARVELLEPHDRLGAESLAPKVRRLVGTKVHYTVDDRGRARDMILALPSAVPTGLDDTVQQIQQSLGSLAAAMPAEPVGLGAKWRVLERIVSGGVETVQLSTYTLTERDGDVVGLTFEVARFACSKVFGKNGHEFQFVRHHVRGVGTSRLHMSSPLAGTWMIEVDLDLEMLAQDAQKQITVGIEAGRDAIVGPKPPARAKKRR